MTKEKWIYAAIAVAAVTLVWWTNKPADDQKNIRIAIETQVKNAKGFITDLKQKQCWVIGEWGFAAMHLPSIQRLECLVSEDQKSVKPIVFQKNEKLP